jgi:hypothetical protein
MRQLSVVLDFLSSSLGRFSGNWGLGAGGQGGKVDKGAGSGRNNYVGTACRRHYYELQITYYQSKIITG